MSTRSRVYAIVAAACLAAAGAAAGVALTPGGESRPPPPEGNPPLELDVGVRGDPRAVGLRRAETLYAHGRVDRARNIFLRYGPESLQARVGLEVSNWSAASSSGSREVALRRLWALARSHPHRAVTWLNLGFVLFWERKNAQALAAWREAKRMQPDSPFAVRADDLLHPRYNRGYPTFVPSFQPPRFLTRLGPRRQLEALAKQARRPDIRAKLLYGVALQRLGRPVSGERMFVGAAALAPGDPDAQVAAAVGRFDKDHPERAFSRLGPLTRRFPRASTVRFHLGLLLLWLGQVNEGTRQLRLARAEAPRSPLGEEAFEYLRRLNAVAKR